MSVMIVYDALKKFGAFKNLSAEESENLANNFELIRAGSTSKYNNMCVMYKGDKYHSLSEAYYSYILNQLLEQGKLKSIARQINYKLEDMNGQSRLRYVADFVVTTAKDDEFIIDVKGQLSDENRIKLAYFRHVYKKAVWLVTTTGLDKFKTDFLF